MANSVRHRELSVWGQAIANVAADVSTLIRRTPSSESILNLIECTPSTETALVEAEQVEELSDTCIRRAWCEQNNVDEEEVIRECTLYLKPESAGNSVKEWLNPIMSWTLVVKQRVYQDLSSMVLQVKKFGAIAVRKGFIGMPSSG